MEMDPRAFARLSVEDLPIPPDVKIDRTWPPILIDIADRIGAYEALVICDAFAGRELYVPADPRKSPFRGLISQKSVEIMAHCYRRERIAIPAGSDTILSAKRQGVIAAIRAGTLTVVGGARILRSARRHISRLVNQTSEGVGYAPTKLPEPRVLVALRQAALVAVDALRVAGAPVGLIESTSVKIIDIFFRDSAVGEEDRNGDA